MLGLLGLGAAALGGLLGSLGSSKATNTQVNNIGKGIALEQGAYNTIREDFNPFKVTGLNALQQLAASLGLDTGAGFKESPGYQFAFNEAMRGVDAAAANKGLINSGARARALQDRAKGLASNEFWTYKKFANDEYFNRLNQLGNLSRMGATATGAIGDAGLHTADMASDFYKSIGAAKASNATNQANNWGSVWGMATTGASGFEDSPLGKLFKLQW